MRFRRSLTSTPFLLFLQMTTQAWDKATVFVPMAKAGSLLLPGSRGLILLGRNCPGKPPMWNWSLPAAALSCKVRQEVQSPLDMRVL